MLRHVAKGVAPLAARFSRQASTTQKIMWTHTDEAPALASYALLPLVKRFGKSAGIEVENADISVAARILAQFPDRLSDAQRVTDTLAQLGELAKTPSCNIIKLPNVSASIPQLNEAIAELQAKGYPIPDYHQNPTTPEEKEVNGRYAKVLGSAVNPVLREGNSDRRVAAPVKAYAAKNPHKMGQWSADSKTHVATMTEGDFYGSEQSVTVDAASDVRIELVPEAGGAPVVLKQSTKLEAHEMIDASFMSAKHLKAFLAAEVADARDTGTMLSAHLKATMMKISDPIMFGHIVRAYYAPLFESHGALLAKAGFNPNNGIGHLYDRLGALSPAESAAVEASIAQIYEDGPRLAMVDSDRGITNLHVPSDVIIDASMPCVVRDSGKMWNADNALEDTKALIPDRCYGPFYQAVVEDCKANGQFDVTTMGNVANVGLMAQKAEEYGSHDKTFEISQPGTVRVVDAASGTALLAHKVEAGDIWRMCQTKDDPIRDWVRLAVSRARATGAPTIFWLDEKRAHDASLIAKVNAYLQHHDTSDLQLSIQPPVEAVRATMAYARQGRDCVSVTGNVLRDYLTDLFPIIELGTSAKMLSIVPLLKGGGLYETGAGGSAPKHVQQFVKEGHLRWDSLGEYLALGASLEDLGEKTGDAKVRRLGLALTEATAAVLDNNKSPSRKGGQLDNRGSTFYIARYWAEALAKHDDSFGPLAKALADNAAQIERELIDCQGPAVDLGGYWQPDPAKVRAAMNPSPTLNKILAN
jgi:isocitrate dehydrogenase